jgi:alpha-L-fucosidase
MWAHWSPQCVPEQGDWYARNMYIQGTGQYESHVKTYGHPSQFGYKDICHLWKAEKWDPEALIKLYKSAGAQYFVALAAHHDNFDCWNSKHQPWNCVNIGPKRDIVGTWAKVARSHGLRFGVSYHGTPGRVWDEFLPVRYKSDTTGPLAGFLTIVCKPSPMARENGGKAWTLRCSTVNHT